MKNVLRYYFSGGCFLGVGLLLLSYKINNPGINISAADIPVKIVDYRQTWVPKLKAAGKCWTSSLTASSNPTGWKCTIGTGINEMTYESCFETKEKKIVCDMDPGKKDSGFEVILTKSLPVLVREGEGQGKLWPWRIRLSSGVVCDLIAEKVGYIGKEAIFYVCPKSVVMGELIRNGDYWYADFAEINEKGDKILERERLNILSAWI